MAGSFETIDLLLDRPSTGEASLSSRLLYKFLHNNLRVGQWELARACIGTLLKEGGNCREIFGQLLRNIVDEPLLYRYFALTCFVILFKIHTILDRCVLYNQYARFPVR